MGGLVDFEKSRKKEETREGEEEEKGEQWGNEAVDGACTGR